MRLIDADALYERAATLESQALDYVGKLMERDGDEMSVEWKIWSAILAERTAFMHDLMDAPTIDAVEVVRCKDCKHCADDYIDTGIGIIPQFTCELGMCGESVEPIDYCSCGERSEKNED